MNKFTSCDEIERLKSKPKVIDLTMMVGSDIDMEFSATGLGWVVGKLKYLNTHSELQYNSSDGLEYKLCRIRQDHWHSFKGDKCPLPEGLIIGYSSTAGARRWVNQCTHYEQLDWSLIYEFKVYGTADDARYEWQEEKGE